MRDCNHEWRLLTYPHYNKSGWFPHNTSAKFYCIHCLKITTKEIKLKSEDID